MSERPKTAAEMVEGYSEFFDALTEAITPPHRVYHETLAEEGLYIVRLWDGMDEHWIDMTTPMCKEAALLVWNEYTENGTRHTKYDDIDYYAIFPADTIMIYSHDWNKKGQ